MKIKWRLRVIQQFFLQVHLITKIIYETLNADFNNTMHVITKIIIVNNKLGFYVALTLFWALYLSYFKKDSRHYYKMYNVDKFFKLLLSNEAFNNNQDSNSMFQLLLLISIYQNYVLLNKENPVSHQVFQEFFKVSQKDREKLKEWLINMKHLIEVNNPLGKSNQTPDVLMVSAVSEYLSYVWWAYVAMANISMIFVNMSFSTLNNCLYV